MLPSDKIIWKRGPFAARLFGSSLIFSATRKYICSLMGNSTLIGSSCETVVSSEVGETRSPTWAVAIEAIPLIGEITLVHSRLSFAVLTAASAAWTWAFVARVVWV